MLCISKQSKKHVEFRFGFKKYDFEKKNQFFDVFQFFFLGVAASKFNFSIFQDFKKFFLKNGLNGTCRMLKETKS